MGRGKLTETARCVVCRRKLKHSDIQLWADLGPVAEVVMSGTPITKDDDMFLFESGEGRQLEEYYHSCESWPIDARQSSPC